MEIYCGNKSKTNQKSIQLITKSDKAALYQPTLFNIHRSEIIVKWNKVYTKFSTLSTYTKIRTLPFTDDQVIIADSEDNLQKGVLTSQNIAKNFGMEMPPEKSVMMAFLGQDPLRCKIMVDNKCLQQVKNFEYLSCEVSYENEKDIQQKVARFGPILGIVSNTFKPY